MIAQLLVYTVLCGVMLKHGLCHESRFGKKYLPAPRKFPTRYRDFFNNKTKINQDLIRERKVPLSYYAEKTKKSYAEKGPVDQTRKVFNGETALPGSIPFQIKLTMISGNNHYTCGGSILNNQWIITAAHCIVTNFYEDADCDLDDLCRATSSSIWDPSGIFITAGEHKLDEKEPSEQIKYPKLIIPHPQYDTNELVNDLALLKLETPLIFDTYVSNITLSRDLPAPGSIVNVSGWGLNENGTISDTLQYANYSVPTNESCIARYGLLISAGMWCTGNYNMEQHTGRGDSGGPVYYRDSTSAPFLVGLTSWGPPDDIKEEDYDVNTNIPFYFNWISENLLVVNEDYLNVTLDKQNITWYSPDVSYQFHRLALFCEHDSCFVEIKVTSMSFAGDNKSSIYIHDGKSIQDERLATFSFQSNLDNTYVSTGQDLLVVVSTGDKHIPVSFTMNYKGLTNCPIGTKACNEINECDDFSDEVGCSYSSNKSVVGSAVGCYWGDFKCDNGYCTRTHLLCDGYNDCYDWSDEAHCSCTTCVPCVLLLLLPLLILTPL